MKTIIHIQDRIEEPLVADWERLARQTRASPFLWPGWISAGWNAFGAGQLWILTAYENGRLTGVLPLRRSHGALSSTTNLETPLFGFLATSEVVVKQLSHALFSEKPRRVDLSYFYPTDAEVSLAHAAADAAGYRTYADSVQAAPYITIDRAWDEYESGLRRKFRSELRRRRRRLEEEGRVTLEVSDGTERLDKLLEEGFRVEGAGWKGDYGTSINSHPATRRFYTDVAHWAAERGWLRLAFLRLNGRALAFDYCLEYNGTHYLLKTGYDPAYRKLGLGMIIRYLMLARAFSEGLATYNFLGVGSDCEHEWKREWTDRQQERLFLRMFASTVLGSLDQAVSVSGQAARERAGRFARSPIFGERGYHMLRRSHAAVRARLSR